MRIRRMICLLVSVSASSYSQTPLPTVPAPAGTAGAPARRAAPPRPPSAPTPRWPDGHIMLGQAPGKLGYWNSGIGGLTGKTGVNLPTNLETDEVPFQPWAKAVFEERRRTQSKNDPHVRCVGPGGPRQFHTPFGLMMYEIPEAKRVIIMSGGGPRTWRVVYMDGRPHPMSEDYQPTYMGHSVGKWEGDTLVIDSVGYNEKFWFARAGYPHTESLHLVERISRPDYNTLKYEVTIDDPKTYTKPWTGGHYIYWTPDEDFDEYFCQDNNRDAEHMVGQ
jgi:hypothetical protein